MKRTHLNFLIDALAFVAMLLLFSTGLILAHKLPPGSGGEHGAGVGRGAAERAVTMLWGWTRHQWGDFHYWIAYGLLAVLALHVILHWKWIVCVLQGKPSQASPYRLLVGTLALMAVVCMTVMPLVSDTATVKRGAISDAPLTQSPGSQTPAGAAAGDSASEASALKRPAEEAAPNAPAIRGSMTLQEISDAVHVPVGEIVRKLNLPADADPSERAGRLLREHGLEITDLRAALELPEDSH